MAYITKEEVKAKSVKLKELAKRYGIKLTVAGSNTSTIKVNIASGSIDFIGNFQNLTGQKTDGSIDVNHYYISNFFDGVAEEFLTKVKAIMMEGHYDNSDVQTDYFDTAWYLSISVGKWNKPYVLV